MTAAAAKSYSHGSGSRQSITNIFNGISQTVAGILSQRFANYAASVVIRKGRSTLAERLLSSRGIDDKAAASILRNREKTATTSLKAVSVGFQFDSHIFSLSCPGDIVLEIRTLLPQGESISFIHGMLRSMEGQVVSIAFAAASGKGGAHGHRTGEETGKHLEGAHGKREESAGPDSDHKMAVHVDYSVDGRKLTEVQVDTAQSSLNASPSAKLASDHNEGNSGAHLLQMSKRRKASFARSNAVGSAENFGERKQEVLPARLLLNQVKLLGKSADTSTLVHSLMTSIREIIGSEIPCRCWTLSGDSSTFELDFEDPEVRKSKIASSKGVDDDSLFSSALSSDGFVLVERDEDASDGRTGQNGTGDSRLLVVLGSASTPSRFLEFDLNRGRFLTDSQLYAMELLANQARSRAEILFSARSLEVEKKVASLLAQHLSGRDPAQDTVDVFRKICNSIKSEFNELEAVTCLRKEGEIYRYVAGTGLEMDDKTGADARSTFISALLPSDSGIAGFVRDSEEWKQIVNSYGSPPPASTACTLISCRKSSEELVLILYHNDRSPVWPFAYTIRTLFTGLAAIDSALIESSKKGSLMVMTERLLDRLETFSFNDGPKEIAGGFADTFLSIAGANMMRFYIYDESVALFTPLFSRPALGEQQLRKLTLHDFNVISAVQGREGDFVSAISRDRKHLWNSLELGETVRNAYVTVVTEGKKPVSLLVTGFSEDRELERIEEHLLMRVSRTLTNLLASSRTLHDTVERSHFSSEFLRILSQSMMFREGGWSFEVEQIANRMCSLIGSTLQKEFVFLFTARGVGSEREIVGKWSRHLHDEIAVNAEAQSVIDLPEGEEHSDSHGMARTLSIEGGRFRTLRDKGVVSATVIHTGNEDGTLPVTLLLLDVSPRQLTRAEGQAVSTALEETRLMLESRLRRSVIDWTLNAMRSELRIARNLSSTFDMAAVLDGTVREVANFLNTEICLIELINDRGGSGLASITDPSGRKLMDMTAGENTPAGQLDERRKGFSTLVMETGGNLSLLGEDACAEALSLLPKRDRSIVEFASGSKSIKSLFGAPLSFAGKLLGLLVCMRTSADSPFGKNETSYIESVAALASTAIENSRNVESTVGALSKLRKLDTLRSNFSSIAAHELRTPLTSIRVYIELMKLGKVGSFTDQEKKNIESLLASISELTDIINNMLEFTRMEAMLLETEMSSVSLRPVIEETCALLSPAANAKSIKLELEVGKEIKNVSANAALIKRVINNLIGNALKFTPDGGRITVKLKNDREGLLIVVEDTGKGIPSTDLPYIFDRFHVVDSSILHSRTGFRLGLPISKLIVERHGGRIWADSEVGKGSKFYVLLPVSHGVSTEEWLSEATGYIH